MRTIHFPDPRAIGVPDEADEAAQIEATFRVVPNNPRDLGEGHHPVIGWLRDAEGLPVHNIPQVYDAAVRAIVVSREWADAIDEDDRD